MTTATASIDKETPVTAATPGATAAATARTARDFGAPVDDATIEKTAEALRAKGYEVFVTDDPATARQIVLDKLPKGAEVGQGASKSLEDIGATQVIEESGEYDAIRPKTRKLDYSTEAGRNEGRKMGAVPDYWLNSVAALTEDGSMLIASNTGSQLGPVAFGAGHVIFVIGSQKIVKNMDEAMRRLEDHVLPLESDRLFKIYGAPSNLSKLLIINKEIRPGRFTVVILRESIGF